MKIMKTKRLMLKIFSLDYVDRMARLHTDPEVMAFFPGIKTRDETTEWIEKCLTMYHRHGHSFYAVETIESGEFVGYCGLIVQPDVDGREEIEIGYGLAREYWGRGYALEAAVACREYGFERLKAERLISLVRPENVRSRRVAERNGMSPGKTVHHFGFPHIVYTAFRPRG